MPSCVSSACQSWLPPELPPMRAAGGTTRRCLSISDSTPVTSTTWEYRDLPINLNLSNRRMRTRMSGGVAGEQRCAAAPYADRVADRSEIHCSLRFHLIDEAIAAVKASLMKPSRERLDRTLPDAVHRI